MDDIYQAHILDHYKNPRNFGELTGEGVVVVREMNASCGDLIEISAKFKNQNSKIKIEDIKFKGVGCALSVAMASMLTEQITLGKLPMARLATLTIEEVKKLLGIEVSPTREKCIRLPLAAIKKAIVEKGK